MEIIINIFLTLLVILLFWGLPTYLLGFLVLKIVKRRISKGWCVLLFLIIQFLAIAFTTLLKFNWNDLGILWKGLTFILPWNIIAFVVYDNTIPSILDTEKQLKEKLEKSEQKEAKSNETVEKTKPIVAESTQEAKEETYEFKRKTKEFINCANKKSIEFLKNLPKDNYHILGYIAYAYLLLITFLSFDNTLEYGYYEILRWLITSFCIWSAFKIYNKNSKSKWLLVFSAIAILFNPIIKITFEEDVWGFIDFLTIIVLTTYVINRIKQEKAE